ncbi:MAG: hypothetical protein EOP86_15985, partial [Verrucomicrobiaceae bacterium]
MKPFLLPTLAVSTGLLFSACDGQQPSISISNNSPPAGVSGPEAAPPPDATDDTTEVERQIADLKAQEAALQLQIQQDQLAQEKAALAQQQADFEKAQENAKAIAAAGKTTTALPPEPEPEPVASAATGEGRDYQAFYEGLAPYGDWRETPDYGYVWQPSSVPADWRPYTVGQWVDSDQGWTWASDEPFGWATYHYGRWALLQNAGWIWVPGDTWAPAWVSWRNNDDYVGWCPMPPETVYVSNTDYGPSFDDDYGISPDCYNFIPVRYFNQPVRSYCRPVSESRLHFRVTVCKTNFTIRPGRVICRGPEVNWVNSCLPAPMRHFRIERDRSWGNDRRDYRPRFDNDRLALYAPRVRAAWNDGIRPAVLRGRLDDNKVVRRPDFKPDLEKRFREALQERRQRSVLALKQEPVRQLAERHGNLEKLRARRDQLVERQNDRTRPPGSDPRNPGGPPGRDRNPRIADTNRDGKPDGNPPRDPRNPDANRDGRPDGNPSREPRPADANRDGKPDGGTPRDPRITDANRDGRRDGNPNRDPRPADANRDGKPDGGTPRDPRITDPNRDGRPDGNPNRDPRPADANRDGKPDGGTPRDPRITDP